ncbi:site-specific integrase [Cryobacterium gelidum]|uniref:Site-specific integrase n=1 Tax=Cryobacterium gelidum TaxID=1259164 RepID=A0A4R9AY71_9MICO|nr:site-specific integrase [Cryobacterium gelidum]
MILQGITTIWRHPILKEARRQPLAPRPSAPGVVTRHRDRNSLVLEGAVPLIPTASLERINHFQRESLAPNTRRAVRGQWDTFTGWCAVQGFDPLPASPLIVAAYLTYAADLLDSNGAWFYAPSTIRHWLSSINKMHSLAGLSKPGEHRDVANTIEGICRERARPIARKAPLLLDGLRKTLVGIDRTSWPHGVIGHRDAAILTIGFGGAFRRSELAALELQDISIHPENGLHIRVRRSKTDQKGNGFLKAIPFGGSPLTCAPCAYIRWLIALSAGAKSSSDLENAVRSASMTEHACRENVPLLDGRQPFLRPVMKNGAIKARHITGNVVNDVVKRRVAHIDLNPADYGAHSLRAGFVTEAFRAGATHHEIMRQTGHRSPDTVEIYSREVNPLDNNAVVRLGL